MSKTPSNPDVLILGQHPSAYVAAIALRAGSSGKMRVVHSTVPGEEVVDRLVMINPAMFELHKSLGVLEKKLDLAPIYGLRFLGQDPKVASEYRDKAAMGYVARYSEVREAVAELAEEAGVEMVQAKALAIDSPDEKGVTVTLGKTSMRVKAIVLAAEFAGEHQKRLGLPGSWGEDVVHRYSFMRLSGKKWVEGEAKPVQPMSLDLNGELCWGWLLCKGDECQIAVEQPVETVGKAPPMKVLGQWAGILHKHGVLKELPNVTPGSVESMDLPLAGALAQEGVADRTLLIGPAGGFYSATSEDLYPCCWSAIFAADVLRKALKEPHLQDAINAYRHVWRTTLGDYLRGPQQNLKFLLPLVYRNPVMTERLTESILQGKSVVR